MKKIPVLATIREAYRFTFTHLGAIIGLIWLPMILLTVIGFFVKRRFLDALAGSLASDSYTTTGPETLGLLCYFIAALLLLAMMCVPVMQLALGTRKQGALIHFGFGVTEWRLFRSLMGLIAFLLLPLLVIIAVISLVQTSDAARLGIAQGLPSVMLLYFLGAIYCGLRFALLLPAVTVSETGPLLSRAWSLTAGNFLRLLAVAAAIFIPLEVMAGILFLAAGGPKLPVPAGELSTAMMAAEFHAMAMAMPLTSGISFLIAPLMLGLSLGAGAAIYRVLTSAEILPNTH